MMDDVRDFFEDRVDDVLDFKDRCGPTQFVCMLLWAVFVILIIVGANVRGSKAAAFEESFEDNRLRIMELEQRKSALSSETDKQDDPEDVEVLLKSAVSSGSAVASLQSAYQDCMVRPDDPSESVETKMQNNARSLAPYFDDDSENAVTPWFTVTSEAQSRVTWKFMTNYSFTSDEVDVLWTCVDRNGRLCAFATGKYTAATNLFSDVKVFATAFGNETYRRPDDPVATYDYDPETGTGIETQPSNTQVPEGYHFNEFGDLVDADGNVYMGDENWAEEFENQFKSAKEYREQAQAKKGG